MLENGKVFWCSTEVESESKSCLDEARSDNLHHICGMGPCPAKIPPLVAHLKMDLATYLGLPAKQSSENRRGMNSGVHTRSRLSSRLRLAVLCI